MFVATMVNDDVLRLRLPGEQKARFVAACRAAGLDSSEILRRYVDQVAENGVVATKTTPIPEKAEIVATKSEGLPQSVATKPKSTPKVVATKETVATSVPTYGGKTLEDIVRENQEKRNNGRR